jgi:hypothetical protein
MLLLLLFSSDGAFTLSQAPQNKSVQVWDVFKWGSAKGATLAILMMSLLLPFPVMAHDIVSGS